MPLPFDQNSAAIVDAGRAAASASRHDEAVTYFRRAFELQTQGLSGSAMASPDSFVIQQLALATYKAGTARSPHRARSGVGRD